MSLPNIYSYRNQSHPSQHGNDVQLGDQIRTAAPTGNHFKEGYAMPGNHHNECLRSGEADGAHNVTNRDINNIATQAAHQAYDANRPDAERNKDGNAVEYLEVKGQNNQRPGRPERSPSVVNSNHDVTSVSRMFHRNNLRSLSLATVSDLTKAQVANYVNQFIKGGGAATG